MKFAHFSDLHLDTPFSWATREIARRRRDALRSTLTKIVEIAKARQVDAVLCGGDQFEQERVSPDTAEFLKATYESLHPIPVFIAPGNHDWFSPTSLYHRVAWSPNVHIFSEDHLEPHALTDGLTLWGAAHRSPRGTGGFLENFEVDRNGIHIALFHGSEMSVREVGKSSHAPFRAEEIECAGLHHAFVGHYHTPRLEDRLTYPGNPDPLSFGEEGERGLVIAGLDESGQVRREVVNVAVSEVHDVEIDVTGARSRTDVQSRVRDSLQGLRGVARLTLRGEVSSEMDLSRQDLQDIVPTLDALIPRFDHLRVDYDFKKIAGETTVRGKFVSNVMEADLTEEERRRILITGLRALEGRTDLEVVES